jgi:hypothetical protein
MKRRFVFGVLVLSAVIAVLHFGNIVSAQKDTSDISSDDAKGVVSPEAPSVSLLVDDFNYSGNLASNGWTEHSPGTGTNPIATTSGLSYAGYPNSGTGNAALVANAGGQDVNKPLSVEQITNGSTVYFSALVNVNDAASDKTGDYFLHIGDRVDATAFTLFAARVFARITANAVNFGLSNTSTATYGTTNFAKNTTYLLIIKYTINTGGNDTTQLWVFPSGVPASEAAAGVAEVNNTATAGQDIIDALALRQGSATTSPQTAVDGIRVGTTWSDITTDGGGPVPGPKLFKAYLNSANEVPPNASTATGFGRVVLNNTETSIKASFYWNNLSGPATGGHIHLAAAGVNGPILFDLAPGATVSGSVVDFTTAVTPAQVASLRAGLWYFNIHTAANTGGEIRGQILRAKPRFDTDGDGDSDYGVIRAGAGGASGQATWFTSLNQGTPADPFTETQWGLNSDTATPEDFDGDGKTDIAFWRPSGTPAFFILRSTTGTLQQVNFGLAGDDPTIVADYSGDGKADPALYRRGATATSQSFFWTLPSSGPLAGVQVVNPWGLGGDNASSGDFDGDGRADFCVTRNFSGANVFIIFTATGVVSYTSFGLSGASPDAIAPGDYDGDGRTDLAVTRFESGNIAWYYRPSGGGVDTRVAWGVTASSDYEAQGDYDGDGKTDIAVWRPTGGSTFFVVASSGGFRFQRWGIDQDVPSIFDLH